jgi:hypothetical protein
MAYRKFQRRTALSAKEIHAKTMSLARKGGKVIYLVEYDLITTCSGAERPRLTSFATS